MCYTVFMNKEKPVIERKDELPVKAAEIWLAGGCFWGLEKYFSGVRGVIKTSVGYANGRVVSPTYKQVCAGTSGCAETVHVMYNPNELPLPRLLNLYMQAIDPTSLNKQGGDTGEQYRTGIYYLDEADLPAINAEIKKVDALYSEPVVVEVKPLSSYYLAEEYHQDYLKKNPTGYCHIGSELCAAAWNSQQEKHSG